MSTNFTHSDWNGSRGEKWKKSLSPMESMLSPLNKPLYNQLNLDKAYKIADIGCGGGDSSIYIHNEAPSNSQVLAYDISCPLIDAAQLKIKTPIQSLQFSQCDVSQKIPHSQYFDRIFSRFGIMFFEDEARAFSNLSKWLTPGGQFVFAAWGPLDRNPWVTSVKNTISQIVELPPSNPKGPGPFRYSNKTDLLKILSNAGFSKLKVHEWSEPIFIGGGLEPKDAATFAINSFGIGEHLLKSGEDAVQEGILLLTKEYQKHLKQNYVVQESQTLFFSGVV